MSTLSVQDLSLSVPDGESMRLLLDDVSFTVDDGEIVGVTGPSGSGKSSLIAVLGCLATPSGGSAVLTTTRGGVVNLHDATGSAAARVRRDHVGLIFQQPNLIPALNVEEQLLYVAKLQGRKVNRAARAEARDLLGRVGLEGLAGAKVSMLSGGQQARVNAARALFGAPDLLLADEPTAALDTDNARSVTQLICVMARERGVPTLFVTHDRNQLDLLDRELVLVDGALQERRPTADASNGGRRATSARHLRPYSR